ncbi:MAG TPA: Hpt domain-containing protein [Candidatus Limnocylindria bacterium]|nr:Hpt domain-containing protein [Candidatus Limnocylindria bacterium]
MSRTHNPTAALIAALWERNQPLVRERVDVLQRAAVVAAGGGLDHALRVHALEAAHKLAGALGMYGRAEAGAVASRMEQMLEADGAVDAPELERLAAELRQLSA